jgi:hypothetical protein
MVVFFHSLRLITGNIVWVYLINYEKTMENNSFLLPDFFEFTNEFDLNRLHMLWPFFLLCNFKLYSLKKILAISDYWWDMLCISEPNGISNAKRISISQGTSIHSLSINFYNYVCRVKKFLFHKLKLIGK